jgi:hypothetical protein
MDADLSARPMTEVELRRELESPGELLALQILTGAFAMGVLLFLAVTVLLWIAGSGDRAPGDQDLGLFPILTTVNAVLFTGCLVSGLALHGFLTRDLGRAASAAQFLAGLRGPALLRLSLLEGSALFGIVVCLLGVIQGAVRSLPWIWANSAPALFFLLFSLATFPTRERVVDLFLSRT